MYNTIIVAICSHTHPHCVSNINTERGIKGIEELRHRLAGYTKKHDECICATYRAQFSMERMRMTVRDMYVQQHKF